MLSLAYPVIDETGRSQAVVLAGLDLSWFNQFVTEAQLPAGATFTLIDARGTVLAHYPDLQRAGQSMPETQLLQTILAQSEGTVEAVGLDGLSRLYAFTPLPTLRSAVAETVPGTPIDGYVSLSIPTEIAFAEINQKLVRNLAALAFVAGLGLVAAWFGSEMFILRQVEALLQATRKLSTGDLNTRIKLSTGSEELKQLAHAFDEMAEALQQREIERQQTETASRHSEALLRQILDTNPNIIFVKDREATIILANQALADSYQTTFEQVMGRSHVELHVQAGMSQVELQQWLLDDRDVIDTGKSKTILEQYTHRDGSIHWNQTKKFPLNLVNGQQGVLVISEDITDRKRAEESLRQTAAELTRSNAELQQFAYVASHDLQEPLRMVASYTQLLARRYEGKLDADADVFINFAVDGANRMQQLINDLLAYSRVGTRSKPPQPTEVRVALESVLTNLKMIIAENKAVVTYDHLPTVLADETQLVQLFQNLIGNALKFRSVQPPTVHISAECKDEEWWFSVQDNGIGIESKYAERIFIIFQRLHNKTDYSGSGIGLAICKRIVERLGGRIWMESQPGQGTTFLFTLPAIGEKNEL